MEPVNYHSDGNMAVFNAPVSVNGNLNVGKSIDFSLTDIIDVFQEVSSDLQNLNNCFFDDLHIENPIVDRITSWIDQNSENPKDRLAVITGDAGQGKSVVMRDIFEKVSKKENICVLALKADILSLENDKDFKDQYDCPVSLQKCINTIAAKSEKFILLVDQLDALSLSLSSNRKALTYYNRLINHVMCLPNAKVVISCRLYDLDCDEMLSRYQTSQNVFEVPCLTNENIKEVLVRKGLKNVPATKLLEFLKKPLHLYWYCRLLGEGVSETDVSLTNLYHVLWNRIVLANKENVDFLKKFSSDLYKNQVLSLSKILYETDYNKSIARLLSENIIVETNKRKASLQFVHQSLFDYVNARLLVESNVNITSELIREHQGLFVRARVQQYFAYLRDVNETRYIKELQNFISNDDIRFHLKLLILSWLAFQEHPHKIEKEYVKSMILVNEEYLGPFIENVRSAEWFQFVVVELNLVDDVGRNDDNAKNLGIILCQNIGWIHKYIPTVAKFLDVIVEKYGKSVSEFAKKIVQYIEPSDDALFKNVYKQIQRSEKTIVNSRYLDYMVTKDTAYVMDVLRNYVEVIISDSQNHCSFNWGYEADDVFEHLENGEKAIVINGLLDCIEIVSQANVDDSFPNDRLKFSRAFLLYYKNEQYPCASHKWVSFVIENMQHLSHQELINVLDRLGKSDQQVLHLIRAAFYATRIEDFKDDIQSLFCDTELLNQADSVTTYYFIELLKGYIAAIGDADKSLIIKSVAQIQSPYETINKDQLASDVAMDMRGRKRAKYLYIFDRKDLNVVNPSCVSYLDEMLRKWKNLSNEKPYSIETYSGWTGLPDESIDALSNKDISNVLSGINCNFPIEIGAPTAIGVVNQLKEKAKSNPERFSSYLLSEMKNREIPLESKAEILSSILQSEEVNVDDATRIFEDLVVQITEENMSDEAGAIIALVRNCSFFSSRKINYPNRIFDFLVLITEKYNDAGDYKEIRKDYYNVGINQPRGSAVDALLKCPCPEERKERLFAALESLKDASVPTRSTLLLSMSRLYQYDEEKALALYLAVMSDLELSLLMVPLFAQHPLLYAIYKHYDKVKEFLNQASSKIGYNDSTIVALWYSWLYGHKDAKELCLKTLVLDEGARLSLVSSLYGGGRPEYAQQYKELLNNLLRFESKDFGERLDLIFVNIDQILTDSKDLENVVDQYVNTSNVLYSKFQFMKFVERQISVRPQKCVEWMSKIISRIKTFNDYYAIGKWIDLLMSAYNSIREYNRDDFYIEKTMDIFDSVLKNSQTRPMLRSHMNKLDECGG